MRKLFDKVAGMVPGFSWVRVAIGMAVVAMLAVVANQLMGEGAKRGRAERQAEVDALNLANATCNSSTGAMRSSLDIQNSLSLALVRDGIALRAATASAKKATDLALEGTADMRRRLREAAARPAADDVPVNDLNREAWEAVRCGRERC